MTKPILLVMHEDVRDREILEQALTDRYSSGYQIICEGSPLSALERLNSLRATAGAEVLILFAADQMTAMRGHGVS
jgi:hypothetical protein